MDGRGKLDSDLHPEARGTARSKAMWLRSVDAASVHRPQAIVHPTASSALKYPLPNYSRPSWPGRPRDVGGKGSFRHPLIEGGANMSAAIAGVAGRQRLSLGRVEQNASGPP